MITYFQSHTWASYVVAGLLRLHCDGVLRRWRHVSLASLCVFRFLSASDLSAEDCFASWNVIDLLVLNVANNWPNWTVMPTFCFANTVPSVKAQNCHKTVKLFWDLERSTMLSSGCRADVIRKAHGQYFSEEVIFLILYPSLFFLLAEIDHYYRYKFW